ncbi:protein NETWORKED 4B [Trifolium repens]|nr:protein NETWORKED 4B [Trifolium repens]
MEESSNSNVGCNEDNISVASMYEDSESVSLEENYLDMEEQNMDDSLLWEMDNRSYEELLKELIENEEELRVSDFKLQLLKDEIISLVEDYGQKVIELEKANNMIDYLKAEIMAEEKKEAIEAINWLV